MPSCRSRPERGVRVLLGGGSHGHIGVALAGLDLADCGVADPIFSGERDPGFTVVKSELDYAYLLVRQLGFVIWDMCVARPFLAGWGSHRHAGVGSATLDSADCFRADFIFAG